MAEFSSACTGSSPVARLLISHHRIMNILLGLVFIAWGIAIIAYSSSLSDAFWRRDRADRHLGGTTQWYVVIWFIIIMVGVVVMFGWGKSISTDVTQWIPVVK